MGLPDFGYRVLVSEFMLQQTQVPRVVSKFLQFTTTYSTNAQLATASLGDVLRLWQGLGYNRRAKFLLESARVLQARYGGEIPRTTALLEQMPGIGYNTAAAIVTYVYNEPVVYIETNIRTAFLYHFFSGKQDIKDTELLPLIAEALDNQSPREWCWALMDYGSHLKKAVGNASRTSKHYLKQSSFEGSRRQLRGAVLRILSKTPLSTTELMAQLDDIRLTEVLATLETERLITQTRGIYSLPEHD